MYLRRIKPDSVERLFLSLLLMVSRHELKYAHTVT